MLVSTNIKTLAFELLLGTACTICAASTALAGTIKDCSVTFTTVGKPVLVKIEGKSELPCQGKYNLSGDKLTDAVFTMDLTKIDTGIPLRNRHLRENYLHTEKFPVATVTISSVDKLSAQLGGKGGGRSGFQGELDIHGVKKPLREATYEIDDKNVTAEFAFEVTDHNIDRPAFMGVKIVDKVIVTVGFTFND